MLTPGPDHPITVTPAKTRWRAAYANHVIADTGDALILEEAGHGAVVYFPREDVSMEYFSRSDQTTHCPYKGDAAYYSILMDGKLTENAVWTYEDPFAAVEQIRGRLAFYPDKVEVYQYDNPAAHPAEGRSYENDRAQVDQVVQHTDTGAGYSQGEHWESNLEQPEPLDRDAQPRIMPTPGEGGLAR